MWRGCTGPRRWMLELVLHSYSGDLKPSEPFSSSCKRRQRWDLVDHVFGNALCEGRHGQRLLTRYSAVDAGFEFFSKSP